MTSTKRALAYGPLLLLICACGAGAVDGDDPDPDPDPIRSEPTLSSEVTGVHNGDALLNVARCQQTSWSFAGCEDAYPLQGRRWLAYECASTPGEIVCGRLARYQIQGVGGSVDREAGLAMLDRYCQQGVPPACAEIAHATVFTDLERARRATTAACGPSPATNLNPECHTLAQITSDDGRRFQATVTTATGSIAVGQVCDVWLAGAHPQCSAFVRCGARVLYGGGTGSYFPCRTGDTGMSGGETMVTDTDGDAAFDVDTDASRVRVWDQGGEHGEYDITARLEARP